MAMATLLFAAESWLSLLLRLLSSPTRVEQLQCTVPPVFLTGQDHRHFYVFLGGEIRYQVPCVVLPDEAYRFPFVPDKLLL